MSLSTSRYLNHVVNHYDTNFSLDILENYCIMYLENIKFQVINKEDLSEIFGNLAFLYSKKEITYHRINVFMEKLLDIIPHANESIIKHISNFFEIVLTYKPELIDNYVSNVNTYINNIQQDYGAILYKAVVLPSLKNHRNIVEILPNIKYPWRSYFQLANYYFYYNESINALNYIIKAVKSCPYQLKIDYNRKKDSILQSIIRD